MNGFDQGDSEIHRTAVALRESEERFRNMADNAPLMVWVTEADGKCTYLSASWYAFTGQTPETGLGHGWLDATHPDDRQPADAVFRAATARREPFRLDYRLRRADGVYRWAIDSAAPRLDEGGAFAGYVGSVVDITERKEAEDALRESEARFRAVFESIDEGYCLCELIVDGRGRPVDYRFLEANPLFEEMTGLENAIGRTALELVPDLERHWVETYARVALDREPLRFQQRSDAMGRSFDVFAAPVDPSPRFALVFNDVTTRRALEQERDRLLHEALTSRAQAEAAQVRAEAALQEAEAERMSADAARRRASFLATVTRRLAGSLDYRQTLTEIVESAVPYIADWGAVSLAEPAGGLRLVAVAHRDPERRELTAELLGHRPSAKSSAARVLATGEPDLVTDLEPEQLSSVADSERHAELFRALGTRHLATWPISTAHAQTLGALTLVLGESGRRFSEGDLELGHAVAQRAGLHITNARLHTERSEIARTLQESLLPRALPEIPGVELASAFLPVGDQNIVGGDFYDVFASGDGEWTAILGDVSGKGAKAAAITAAARHTLRVAALMDSRPAADLALLNRILLGDLSLSDFCTVICARLRPGPDGATVQLANGGHPPALVLRGDGPAQPVEGGRGPLVGVLTDAEFDETEFRLGPGDLMLLYTDGVTEVRPDATVGESALVATLERHRGSSARAVVDAVTSSALRLHGGIARDDIAALAIRIPAP